MKYTVMALDADLPTHANVIHQWKVTHMIIFTSDGRTLLELRDCITIGTVLYELFGKPGPLSGNSDAAYKDVTWVGSSSNGHVCYVDNIELFESAMIEWKLTHGD